MVELASIEHPRWKDERELSAQPNIDMSKISPGFGTDEDYATLLRRCHLIGVLVPKSCICTIH